MNWSAGKIGTIDQRSAQANGLSTPPIGCVLHLVGLPGGGNKIYDRSPYGNIGTIVGAVWKRLPSGLWCLSFDGNDDYISCGTNSVMDFTSGDFTIEAWIRTEDLSVSNVIFCRGDLQADGYSFWINSAGYLNFQTWQSTARQDTNSSTGGIVVDAWYHTAVTRVGAVAKLYKNGLDDTITAGTHQDPTSSPDAAEIGIHNSANWPFEGFIALPRVYNRALSALEIQNHFNREKHLFGAW